VSYRLLVTDLDGTLLDRSGAVGEEDRAALRELQRREIRVSVLTGRMYSGTRQIARDLAIRGPIACVDGSHIVAADTDRDLVVRHFAPGPAGWLRELLAETRPTTFLFAGEGIVHDAAAGPQLPYLRLWTPRLLEVKDVFAPALWLGEQGPMAVVSLAAAEQIQPLAARINRPEAPGLQASAFNLGPTGIDALWGMVVRAAGTDKGTALAWVASHYGLRTDQVVAVGDWVNDVPMLRTAGRSFAMGQAPSEVKAAATDVLRASVRTGGGIAEAARRSGLL